MQIKLKDLKRILLGLVFFIIPLEFFFIFAYTIYANSVEREAYSRIVSEQEKGIYLVANLLEQNFAHYISDLQVVFNSAEFSSYIQDSSEANRENVEQLFLRIGSMKDDIKQIRFLDKEGKETIRVNREGNLVLAVPKTELQDKRASVYFPIIKTLAPHELYISNMDLAVEKDTIVEPYEPILRLGYPVYKGEEFIGTVLINFDGYHLLSFFPDYQTSLLKNLSLGLIDSSGSWMVKDKEYIFGFHYKIDKENNLFLMEPAFKNALASVSEGALEVGNLRYAFHTVTPVLDSSIPWYPGGDRFWTVVSYFDKTLIPILDSNYLLTNPQIEWIAVALIFILGVLYLYFFSQRKNDRLQLMISSIVSNFAHDGIIVTDKDQRITFCNKAFEHLVGYTQDELIGKTPKIFSFETFLANKKNFTGLSYFTKKRAIWDKNREGNYFLTNLVVSEVKGNKKTPEFYVGFYTQVRQNYCEKIDFTLPENEIYSQPIFFLKEKIKREEPIFCILLQIMNYPDIEAKYLPGEQYEFMNFMLKEFSKFVGNSDPIVVYSPDTYLLTITDCQTPREVELKLENMLSTFEKPIAFGSLQCDVQISCGVSGYPQCGGNPQELLNNACLAKQLLKNDSPVKYQFFNQEVHALFIRKHQILGSISAAFANKELQLYFQPQIEISTNKIIGAEALIRWNSPQLGSVSPGEFIPILEENGLVAMVGKFVIKEAVQFLSDYGSKLQQLDTSFRLAINLTAEELSNPSIIDLIGNELERMQVPASLLSVELTERSSIENFKKAGQVIDKLQQMGLSIAIDDFGTGFSSLVYLLELSMDKIKIDRAYIMNYREAEAVTIIKTIIRMAEELRIPVLAEGVETEEQLQFLKSVGCAQYQGFLYSKAVPAEDFMQLSF
ncbi:EAL domain-containing protein [uncultured Sphaerochaeta sp.]|uniref:EAL domain-containing protein n=1 Tax=uncultured Sphaerochaeta sp. TaxID=886478 RepID=UPI002A0A26FB|nr:EAL domain-containing protein [uncultured Sphaerochaeta sp.]